MTTILRGASVELRPITREDIPELARIRATPDVYERWGGGPDMAATVAEDMSDVDVHILTIFYEGRVVGSIQWGAEDDPQYRHANIDIYLDPAVHGLGLGTDAVRTLARHLLTDHAPPTGHRSRHADSTAAIRPHEKVGFRQSASCTITNADQTAMADGLLMELLAEDHTAG